MRPLILFYTLVIYVLLQFSWWAYLLVELNKEVYAQKTELAGYHDPKSKPGEEAIFHRELKERWMMVAGEGLVFMALLVIGIYMTRKAFNKEFALARQQKNFLLSITHEFKSPLAAVKLNLQTLQKRVLAKEQQESIILKALNETDRIHTLIENALLAARIESHNFNLQMEEFNLSECVRSIIQNRQIPGVSSRANLLDVEDGIYIKGDPLAIASLILNLVENAEKYSPEYQPVLVRLRTEKKHAAFYVEDHGTGIPDSEKPRIFDKFYRIGNEETRNAKGTGLGLFIVRHIVDFHHGEIKVYDNKPAGTVFKIILPMN